MNPRTLNRLLKTYSAEEIFFLAEVAATHYAAAKPLLTSPGMIKSFLRAAMNPAARRTEAFHVLYMDTQNQLIAHEVPFQGTVDSCAVHVREIVVRALHHNAAAVVFAHNHPSGTAEPSAADRAITERLKSALALVEVRVLDHMVIGYPDVISLAERGWI